MKKLFLAAAVSALSVSAAQAAPVVYGKLNVAIAETDTFGTQANGNPRFTQATPVANVNSYASRLGVKGEEKLTDNLNAIYQAEWEVNAVGGNGPVSIKNGKSFNNTPVDWNTRNRFLGLKYDGIGAVKVGKMDTALKNIQGRVDIFKDMDMDHKVFQTGENRPSNVISFESDPRALAGVGATIQLIEAQGTQLAGSNSSNYQKNFGSAVSGALTYENKDYGVYAAAGADQNVASTFAGTHATVAGLSATAPAFSAIQTGAPVAEAQTFRVVGGYNFGALSNMLDGLFANVLLQSSQPVHLSAAAKAKGGAFYGFDRENSGIISGGYTIPSTPITIKGQYGISQSKYTVGSNVNLQVWGGMVDYKLNSHARAYAFYSQFDDNRIADAANNKQVHERGTGGLGLEYNF